MSDQDDPSRLLDSPAVPSGLRETLKAAQADVGSEAQVARLAARLGPLLGPAMPAPTGVAASAAASGAAKLGLAALALMVAGGGVWLYSAPGSPPKSAPPPAPISAPASAPAQPTPPTVLSPSAAEAPAVAPPASPASVQELKPAAKPAPVAQLSEAELLEQARSALRGDPARALARANEHRSRFPGGVLVQEREVIAIKALRALGRSAEADRRTAAFEKAFPGSAFQRKLTPSP